MQPFDLEKAKKGVPMRTRDDRKAIFVAMLNGGQPAPLVIEVWDAENDEEGEDEFDDEGEVIEIPHPIGHTSAKIYSEPIGRLENYFINGMHDGIHENDLDLFMEY